MGESKDKVSEIGNFYVSMLPYPLSDLMNAISLFSQYKLNGEDLANEIYRRYKDMPFDKIRKISTITLAYQFIADKVNNIANTSVKVTIDEQTGIPNFVISPDDKIRLHRAKKEPEIAKFLENEEGIIENLFERNEERTR